jgi:hypothetical protein
MDNKQKILSAIGGDFSAYNYYADDYEGGKDILIYSDIEEASKAFDDDMLEAGIEDYLPLENYLNPINN